MPRNGSGTYSLPSGNPVVTNTTVSSTWANDTLDDLATALTDSLAVDGQTSPTANLPMATHRHTGVGNSSARTDYASAADVQDNTLTYLTSVSGTNTITASAPNGLAAYAEGQRFSFLAAGANTDVATLNINSLGAKSIKKWGTTALASGDIPDGAAVTVIYDGTNFQLLNVANVITRDADIDFSGTVTLSGAALAGTYAPFSTGDVKLTLKTAADTGWVLFDDGTIGDASSGGTNRANADCEDLFKLLWANISNTDCPIQDSSGDASTRGSTSDDDWVAHKRMPLPLALGRELAIAGAGSGLTSRALGSHTGDESQTLTADNLPSLSHTHTQAAHTHSLSVPAQAGGQGGSNGEPLEADDTGTGDTLSYTTGSATPAIASADPGGSATAVSIISPRFHLNVMAKL